MSVNEIAESLGAKPEEVQPKIPVLLAWREFQYDALPEDSTSLCVLCADKATHKQIIVYSNPMRKTELEDSNYYLNLCTVCRDKEIARREKNAQLKPSPYPDERYVRFAGYHKSKPSFTAAEWKELREKMEKELEQSRRDASGEPESITGGTPVIEGQGELTNQAASSE